MSSLSRRFVVAALVCSAIAIPASSVAAPPADAPDPSDPEFATWLLDYVDDLHRGDSSHAVLTMHVKTDRWERKLEFFDYHQQLKAL